MTDLATRKSDPPKNPPHDCTDANEHKCPNMKEYGNSFEYEHYKCEVCGRRYKLDYEEMK
jgi:hypothetical protein